MTETRTLKRTDVVSISKLDAQLRELQASGGDEIIVDMEETAYISSVRLQAFASTQKKMNKNGGSMILRNVQPCIKEIFEVTGFGGVLIIEQWRKRSYGGVA